MWFRGGSAWGYYLRRLLLLVALVARPEQLIKDDCAQRAQSQVVERERQAAEVDRDGLSGRDPRGDDERYRRHREVGALGEVDFGVDPNLATDDGDQTEEIHLDAALHADRDAAHQSPKDRDEPQQDREDRRYDEDHDREDTRDAHDADVLGIGGFSRAAEQSADGGGDAITHESAAEHVAEVALHDPADRVDVACVLGHQDHRDEEEQAESGPELAEVGEAEGGHADDRRIADGVEVDMAGGLGVRARRIDGRDDIADHDADQHRQHPREASEIDGGADRGQQRDHRGEGLARKVAGRCAGQGQPDHGDDRARDYGGQQVPDRIHAHEVHDDSDRQVDDAGHEDARVGQSMVRVRTLDGEHRSDKGEAGAEIARYLEARDGQKDQCRHAAEEDDRVRIEPQDQRHQDGVSEHGHHVL